VYVCCVRLYFLSDICGKDKKAKRTELGKTL
jgi:hypothetical protein